jgi:hypothetical protein
MRTKWMLRGIALLMGCLVGGYWYGAPAQTYPGLVAVVVSALALALPVLISVGIDSRITRRGITFVSVAAITLLLGSLLVAGAAFPAVWQGYSNDASYISVLGEMLLAPIAAAFAFATLGARQDPDGNWVAQAIVYSALAWLGVGLQNVILPYIVPLASLVVYFVVHHTLPPSHGGWTYGYVFVIIIAVIPLIVIYFVMFGFAISGGLLGGLLRRLPTRRPATSPPSPVTAGY